MRFSVGQRSAHWPGSGGVRVASVHAARLASVAASARHVPPAGWKHVASWTSRAGRDFPTADGVARRSEHAAEHIDRTIPTVEARMVFTACAQWPAATACEGPHHEDRERRRLGREGGVNATRELFAYMNAVGGRVFWPLVASPPGGKVVRARTARSSGSCCRCSSRPAKSR